MRSKLPEPKDVHQGPSNPARKSLWTLPELADEAQVCRRFLELEIGRGRLIAIRISNRVRVRDRDWQAYLNAGATAGEAT